MSKLIKVCFFLILCVTNSSLLSQNKTQLQKEKQKIETSIKEINNKINTENKKKNSALSQLKLSNQKIDQHRQLILNLENTINSQIININLLEQFIIDLEIEIKSKEQELKLSIDILSKLLYQSHIWKNTYNEDYFLISSKDLNQLYKRKQYLNQLTLYRANQIKKIKEVKKELIQKNNELVENKNLLIAERNEKEVFFEEQIIQSKKLNQEIIRSKEIIEKIKQNEQFYKTKLIQQQQQVKEIEDKIKKIIEEEIRKAREEAKKNNSETPLTPESLELSAEFEKNKGKLPWPLEKGVISERYGLHKNKYVTGVETKNNGLNFYTEPGEYARTVFDGKISRIFYIKGMGKAVLINHGEYFTVYSGLKNVLVNTGERVFSKQKIGTVITSESESTTELHFEIWYGKNPQNPLYWLYKAK